MSSPRKPSEEWLRHLTCTRDWVDERLETFLKRVAWHPSQAAAARYVVAGGGKAVRPALVYWNYTQLSGNKGRPPEEVLDLGLALEFVHCYSLAHDDLPCMDNDDFRRGRPTLHRIQGEALAVLGGDALLTGAFELLSYLSAGDAIRAAAMSEIARAAGGAGMIAGQSMDLDLKTRTAWTLEDLVLNHNLKTGALFGASLALGCLSVDPRLVNRCREWGVKLGLLFQVVDDILDAGSATDARGDEGPNFVKLMGLEAARRYAQQVREELASAGTALGWSREAASPVLDFFVQRSF